MKNQSKQQDVNVGLVISPAMLQIGAVVIVVLLVAVGIFSAAKSLAPNTPTMSDSEMSAHATANAEPAGSTGDAGQGAAAPQFSKTQAHYLSSGQLQFPKGMK